MLTKEQVSALEARAMSSGESFLCTDDTGKQHFIAPFSPHIISELAWHKATEFGDNDGTDIKKNYKRKSSRTYTMNEAFVKNKNASEWTPVNTDTVQTSYNIVYDNLYNCTAYTGNPTKIKPGEEITLRFIANANCGFGLTAPLTLQGAIVDMNHAYGLIASGQNTDLAVKIYAASDDVHITVRALVTVSGGEQPGHNGGGW